MSKPILLGIIVALLGSVVGYLAMDRYDHEQAKQKTATFKKAVLK